MIGNTATFHSSFREGFLSSFESPPGSESHLLEESMVLDQISKVEKVVVEETGYQGTQALSVRSERSVGRRGDRATNRNIHEVD